MRFDSASAEFAGASGMGARHRAAPPGNSAPSPRATASPSAATRAARAARAALRRSCASACCPASRARSPSQSATSASSIGRGHRIAHAPRTRASVAVRVGSGGGISRGAVGEARSSRAHAAPASHEPRDLDGDGLVLVADLAEAARAWDAARETRPLCGLRRCRRQRLRRRLRRRARRARRAGAPVHAHPGGRRPLRRQLDRRRARRDARQRRSARPSRARARCARR